VKKDSQARVGRTKCDFCNQPSKRGIGQYLVCEVHAYRASHEHVKEATDASDMPLKAAPISMSEQHQG